MVFLSSRHRCSESSRMISIRCCWHPSLSRSERRRIVAELQRRQPLCCKFLCGWSYLRSGSYWCAPPCRDRGFAGRDPVAPVRELLGPGLRDAVVCVTGAGGSIDLALSPDPAAGPEGIDPFEEVNQLYYLSRSCVRTPTLRSTCCRLAIQLILFWFIACLPNTTYRPFSMQLLTNMFLWESVRQAWPTTWAVLFRSVEPR